MDNDDDANAGVTAMADKILLDSDADANTTAAADVNSGYASLRDDALLVSATAAADDQEAASTTIQGMYRGCPVRTQASADCGQWLKQFDPSLQQVYFYNAITGQSQWEQPHDFVDGIDDPKTSDTVKVQSVYRSRRAREQVESSRSDGDSAVNDRGGSVNGDGSIDGDDDGSEGHNVRAVFERTDSSDADAALVTHETAGNGVVAGATEPSVHAASSWYDCQHNETTSAAALAIQCAFRQHSAGKAVELRRNHLRDLTDPDAMRRKVSDLMRAVDEIEHELSTRQLHSDTEREAFPHLRELLASWTATFAAIRDQVLELPHRAQRVQAVELVDERVVHARALHDAMAETRSECLALLRSIYVMNSYFVELDVERVNGASVTLRRWKQHELCALADPRIVKVVPLDDLREIFAHVESAVRRAMGLTDFSAGATTATGKRYEEWHIDVAAALASVQQMEQRLAHKVHLLHVVRMAQTEKRELARMTIEDDESSQLELQQRTRARQATAYAAFLAQCRASWGRGLEKRQDDVCETLDAENAKRAATARKMELVERMHRREHHRRATTKLSVWEAVKAGHPVEIVRTMVFAEMQKARRLGYDFVLRSARSDRGETLLQIACWWGHKHLVAFLLEEGANVHDVDSHCNKFSLLHDAARRGHEQVIRILLKHSLRHDVVDRAGDTPLHWAARRSHYDAVHTLLEAHAPYAEQSTLDVILTTVRTKNHRGKTPHQVAKNESIRRLIQAFDDGRLPLFRHPRASAAAGSNRRMTDFPAQRSPSSRMLADARASVARAHSLKCLTGGAHESHALSEHAPEDEFGITDVFTPRAAVDP